MKYYVFVGLLALCTAYPARTRRGVIHDEGSEAEEKSGFIGESSHHHHIEHEHAKSHQSIKFEHFHPVPVYVKKEHSHLLKDPLEKGKFEHVLKLIHPETEHNHGGGLVLENHRHETEGHHHSFSDHSDNVEDIVHLPENFGQGEEHQPHHEWGEAVSADRGSYATHELQQESGGGEEGAHYQYEPIDFSQHAQQEEHASEGY